MLIGFNIECTHKFISPSKNKDENIAWFRKQQQDDATKFNIGYFNALELCFTLQEEKQFNLSSINYKWLSSLKHLSYHLTQWTDDTKRIIEQLPYINYFIIHSDKLLFLKKDFLDKYGHKLLIENTENSQPNFYLFDSACFDIAHAQSYCSQLIENYFKRYKYQIKEIHCSCYDKEKLHTTFYNNRDKFPDFDMKEYPVIIESNFEDMDEIKKELIFLKDKIYD